jgi:copper(I)-binding protein
MVLKSIVFIAAAGIAPMMALAGQAPVMVSHPWFRYLLPQIPAGGFMTLKNNTAQPIILTGVQSPACGMAMLHRSVNKSGMDMMTAVKSVTIPAHGEFRFAPGGYHVMCMQPKMSVGTSVSVTFMFEKHKPIRVPFPVEGPNGPPASE